MDVGRLSAHEPEYEVWWRVSARTTHQSSYPVSCTDTLQYQAYSIQDGGWTNVNFSQKLKNSYFGAKRFA